MLCLVSLTLEEPQAPEFTEGSSKDVEHLSQQLQQSASFTEDPSNVWLGGSIDEADLFEF